MENLFKRSHGLMNGRYWDIVRSGKDMPDDFFDNEDARIFGTRYEDYIRDSANFETGGFPAVLPPSRETFDE